jgi:hypothetical protein
MFILMVLTCVICACADGHSKTETPSTETHQPIELTEPDTLPAASGEVIITFDYEKQSGSASNQFAVWVEDMNEQFIKTIYATRYTASGGYKDRPDSIALWVEKSSLASMKKSEEDAITGATPKEGTLTYTWDLTDKDGGAVSPGKYKFFVDGTLRWKNYVLYSGVIEIGDKPSEAGATAEFVYETSDRYGALTGDSTENKMIGSVTASFIPADLQ